MSNYQKSAYSLNVSRRPSLDALPKLDLSKAINDKKAQLQSSFNRVQEESDRTGLTSGRHLRTRSLDAGVTQDLGNGYKEFDRIVLKNRLMVTSSF